MTNHHIKARIVSYLLPILLIATTSSALADTLNERNSAVQNYPKEYFSSFNPQTARDMIERLPGFTIDTGADLRGFGGGAGNVLINGSRPSSKVGGVEEALERINAAMVVRIELITGSAGISETAGQSVVANVITQQVNKTSRWELQLERADHGKVNTAAEWVSSRKIGNWDTSTKIDAYIERKPLSGTRTSRDASDEITFDVLENSPNDIRLAAFSSQAQRAVSDGILVINGQLTHVLQKSDTERLGYDGVLTSDIADQRQLINFERTITDSEIGIDWTRPLSQGWSSKLLSLSSYKDIDSQSLVFIERPIATDISNSLFNSQQQSFETVARAIINRDEQQKLTPEFGAELAYNRLNSNLALQFEDVDGRVDVTLPAANVEVTEYRGEVFANLDWNMSQKLAVETGLSMEWSKIKVSGDANNSQSFFFVKPFTTLLYDPRPGVQLRLGARRTVGQLDFSDFAASASAADDRLLGGNPELAPDQTTRLYSAIDLRSQTSGAVNIEVFHEWRDDVLEQIVLPSGAQGLGNAGSAKVWGIKSTASLPLSPIITGGLIEVEAEFLDSSFEDPIIASDRSVSSIDSSNILVEFRQDLIARRIAWGLSYQAPLEGPFFFADEISINRDGRFLKAFVETTHFFDLKTNLTLEGIGERNFFRERQFFDPDRGGAFLGSQVISRDRGMFVTLTMSGQF